MSFDEQIRRQAELDRDAAHYAVMEHLLRIATGLMDAVALLDGRLRQVEDAQPKPTQPLPPNAVVEEPLACDHALVNFVRQAEVRHAKAGWQRLRMGAIVQAPPQPESAVQP